MNINTEKINELCSVVENWQQSNGQIASGEMTENEFENELDTYLSKLDKFQSTHNVQKIGEGRDRLVFTSGNLLQGELSYIIKVSKTGGSQNRDEINMWKEATTDQRKHFAHIFDWSDGYRWVIQERVSQGSPPNATKQLRNTLAEESLPIGDVRPDNVGVRKKTNNKKLRPLKPVILDLAI